MRAARACVLAAGVFAALVCATPAQATIYYRGTSSTSSASGATVALTAPANTAVSDFLIMDIESNAGSPSVPSGWTTAYNGVNWSGGSLGSGHTLIAYKVAASGDVGGSWNVGLGSTTAYVGRVLDYVGVATSSEVENTFDTGGTNPNGAGSTSTITYPSVTTNTANSMVLFGGAAFHSGSATTISTPSGATLRTNVNSGGGSPFITSQYSDLTQATTGTVSGKTSSLGATSATGAVTFALKPAASGVLQFATAPAVPAFGAVALNGQLKTTNATMPNFAVDDTTSGTGWNVTVAGDTSVGKSAVFKQYCSNGASACGSDAANSYVATGHTLPAGSLTLNTTGATWTTAGGTGTAPAFQCSTACPIDASSASKIVSTASGTGKGPWTSTGLSATSLALTTPTTTYFLPTAGEVYRVDLLWSLNSGP